MHEYPQDAAGLAIPLEKRRRSQNVTWRITVSLKHTFVPGRRVSTSVCPDFLGKRLMGKFHFARGGGGGGGGGDIRRNLRNHKDTHSIVLGRPKKLKKENGIPLPRRDIATVEAGRALIRHKVE